MTLGKIIGDESKRSNTTTSGLLGFLTFSLIFLSPIFSAYYYTSNPEYYVTEIPSVDFLIALYVLFGICWSIYAGISLWKYKPNAVKITKYYLIFLLIDFVLGSLLLWEITELRFFIAPLIWLIYLYNSEKVKFLFKEKNNQVKLSGIIILFLLIFAYYLLVFFTGFLYEINL